MKVQDALRDVASILLDTAPVIYHLEKNPAFSPVMERFFQLRAQQGILLVTTPITLAECLVLPVRQDITDLKVAYQALITAGENTTFWPIGAEEGRIAAQMRGKYGLTLVDSLQVAVAVQANCDALLTNDTAIAEVTEIRVLLVGELEP